MEYNINEKELKMLSYNFRTVASRLLSTDFDDAMDNLKRFISFIDTNPVLYDYVDKKMNKVYNINDIYNTRGYRDRYPIPHSEDEEISFTYQLLNYALENISEYFRLASGYSYSTKLQDQVNSFNKSVVLPFVNHIISYLERISIEMGVNNRKEVSINISGGTVGQFNFSQDGSVIHANNNLIVNDIEQFNKLSEDLSKLFKNSPIEEDEQEEIKDILDVTKEQLLAENPKKGIIKICKERLKNAKNIVKEGTAIYMTIKSLVELIDPILKNLG